MTFETEHFCTEQLGGSWIVRLKQNGEIWCFRPTQPDAIACMQDLESGEMHLQAAVLPEPTRTDQRKGAASQ